MRIAALLTALGLASVSGAATWNFELSTGGEDVFWTSPTSVDPMAFGYNSAYTIDSATATVQVLGAPVEVNALDMLPPELLTGMALVAGPAPVVLFDEFVASPPPPETASLAADVRIELDAMGFANASATNVTLGTVTVNVPPFGNISVPLIGMAFTGTITFDEILTPLQDLNGDGVVDASDLAQLLAAWGACPAAGPCPADFNADGFVNAADLAVLLAAWG